MSAFGGKADMAIALQMSAYDPKRTSAIPKRPCDVTPHLFLSAAASISNDAGKYLTLCHGLPASDEGNAPFHLIIDAFVDDLRALIETHFGVALFDRHPAFGGGTRVRRLRSATGERSGGEED